MRRSQPPSPRWPRNSAPANPSRTAGADFACEIAHRFLGDQQRKCESLDRSNERKSSTRRNRRGATGMPVVQNSNSATLLLVLWLVGCASPGTARSESNVRGYDAFISWLATSSPGASTTLQNVEVMIWLGETILVFPGRGSIYDRCHRVAASAEDIATLRRLSPSRRAAMRVTVQTQSGQTDAGICSPERMPPVRARSFSAQTRDG
jgi:hypothetical protein